MGLLRDLWEGRAESIKQLLLLLLDQFALESIELPFKLLTWWN